MLAKPIALFERSRIITPQDCDALGHVNNAVWVRFLADLAEAHADVLGLGHEGMVALDGAWVARSHQVFYHDEAWPGDTVLEQTWVSSLKGPRCLRHYRFCKPGGELLFRGDSEWIFVDAEQHRPRRLTPAVIQAFSPIAGDSKTGPLEPSVQA